LILYVELFGGERAGSDTGGICFDDANGFLDALRWDAETRADAANGRWRGSDIGISSEIEVKHGRIGAFTEDTFIGIERSFHESNSINHVIPQFLCVCLSSDVSVVGCTL
jgi:hypothetical protein